MLRKSKRKGYEDAVPDISAIKIHGSIHKALGSTRGKAVFHTHQHYSTALACTPNKAIE